MPHRPLRRLARVPPLALFALAVVAFVVSDGSLPHVHGLDHPGLHNQEHDLGYLATFSSAGPLPDAPALAPFSYAVLLDGALFTRQPSIEAKRHADFRAPPVR